MKRTSVIVAGGMLILAAGAITGATIGVRRHPRAARSLACRLAFDYYLHQDAHEIDQESRSGESGVYYFTSYFLNGMLSAVEGTRSERLLRRTLHYMDNMMAAVQTVDFAGRRYQAWGPFIMAPDSNIPKPNVHYTLQACVPLARAAAIIRQNPDWQAKFAAQAQRYVDFVDDAVIQYWYVARFGRRVPWLDTDNVPIWNDNATNMGLVATFLYQATGKPEHRAVAEEVGRAFRAKLYPAGRGWIWESQTIPIGSDTDNTPGSVGNQAGVPDTSHTNREPALVIFLHESGILFTNEDIQRMAATFLDNIWNQSYEDPSFANYLNGSNKPYRVYREPGLNGAIYHGWALVGGYSADVQHVLLRTLAAIVRGKNNPALVRNATSYGGRLALAGHLLRNDRVASHN